MNSRHQGFYRCHDDLLDWSMFAIERMHATSAVATSGSATRAPVEDRARTHPFRQTMTQPTRWMAQDRAIKDALSLPGFYKRRLRRAW